MRITHADGQHVVCLSDAEALTVIEACALIVVAVQSDERVSLPPEMGRVLGDLFEGLRSSLPAVTSAED
jgi:hypothetical protein